MSKQNIEIGKAYVLKSPLGIISEYTVIAYDDELIEIKKNNERSKHIRIKQFLECVLY